MKTFKQVIWPPEGRYVVAVSGGVDSVSLLDLLVNHPQSEQWELIPAHFNHGWAGDDEYEKAATKAIGKYGREATVGRGQVERSEAAAREARYDFLRGVMQAEKADAIITAHHRDDLEETVLLNVERGTGRHGLSPFARTPDILRPLLNVGKAELVEYAKNRGLEWCHDTYNDDLHFRRNLMRHKVIPELEKALKFHETMAGIVAEAGALNREIDAELARLFKIKGHQATAEWNTVRRLDMDVLTELLVAMVWAVKPGAELSRRTIEVLAVDLKTGRLRRRRALSNSLFAEVARGTVTIVFTP